MPDATDATKPAESNRRAAVLRVTVKSPAPLVGICEYNLPVLNRAGTMSSEGVGILKIEYYGKSGLQATVDGILCRCCPVGRSTGVEGSPCRSRKATLQHIGRIAVAVADEHCLEKCISDDATHRWSDGRNLAAVPSADDYSSGHGLAAQRVSGQQVFAS